MSGVGSNSRKLPDVKPRFARRRSEVNESELSEKVADLEKQLGDYKQRLRELRRAKTQTVHKLEKTYVAMGGTASKTKEPQQKPCAPSVTAGTQTDNSDAAGVEIACQTNVGDSFSARIRELEDEVQHLKQHNSSLIVQVDDLNDALSAKEAEWCQLTDQMRLRLSTQMDDRYAQWSQDAEKRLQYFREASTILNDLEDLQRTTNSSNRDGNNSCGNNAAL